MYEEVEEESLTNSIHTYTYTDKTEKRKRFSSSKQLKKWWK